MDMEPGVLFQPGLDRRALVGAVVVTDQVDVEPVGDLGVDLDQEVMLRR